MPPNQEEVRAEMDDVEQGAPIPPLELSIAKQLWEADLKALAASSAAIKPIRTNAANAVGSSFLDSQQFVRQFWRGHLLTSFIARGVLHDYLRDEQSVEKIVTAVANFPCKKDDVAEAMLLLHLTQVSQDEARKAKTAMKAEGLDLDNSKVDARFIQWMKDNC